MNFIEILHIRSLVRKSPCRPIRGQIKYTIFKLLDILDISEAMLVLNIINSLCHLLRHLILFLEHNNKSFIFPDPVEQRCDLPCLNFQFFIKLKLYLLNLTLELLNQFIFDLVLGSIVWENWFAFKILQEGVFVIQVKFRVFFLGILI